MSGTVDVFTQTVFDAVAIPIQAVTVRDVNALAREAREAERRRPGAGPGAEPGAVPGAEPGAVPDTSSVIPEGEDLRQVIFLFQDGKAVMKGVETGISDDTHIVVLSGVEVGQKVITGPFRAVSRTLKPDASVEERKEGPGAPGGSES
jgi:HlyD family secretion protein